MALSRSLPEAAGRQVTTVVLYPIFFCSGAAALIFETLWFRGAGLTFGNSVWASSITLAAYMAGLALGNALTACVGVWSRQPVRTYALLELLIAGSGLLLVALFPLLPELLAPRFGLMEDGSGWSNLLRLSAVFLLLVLPTSAMGATLPLLVKALCDARIGFGHSLGRLYGWNTLGALSGVLAGEFFLIERFGMLGAGLLAASLNILAAGLSLWLARKPAVTPARAEATRSLPAGARGVLPMLVLSGFLAGAVLMGAEVLWFRFLRLFFLDTESTFAIMLAVVLAGIGLGGMLGAVLLDRFPRRDGLTVVVAGICGVALVVSYAAFDPRLSGNGWYVDPRSIALLSMQLMFPSSLASGVLFTLLGQAIQRRVPAEIRATAILTTANTLGAMCGALLAGFVLLPSLGVEKSFWVLACLYGVMVLALTIAPGDGKFMRHGALAVLVMLVVLAGFPFGRMASHLDASSEKFRPDANSRTVAVSEGVTETLQYLQTDWLGQPIAHELMTNGFSMTDSKPGSRRYMGMYAFWPAALHPSLESALLISYGMGNTAKSLTQIPFLKNIHVVDISSNILRHADIPYPADENPLADPRVKVMVDDGRYYLQATQRRYDLITSEPPPPRAPGVVSLYTEEYFRLIRSRLNEGGMATYWLPVHNMAAADAKAILKAFCNAFPDCALWGGYELNWMMTGSRNLVPTTAERFSLPWTQPQLRQALAEVGLEREAFLGASFMADAAQLERMLGDVLPLVDNYPKRYSQAPPGQPDEHLYAQWMDPAACRQRFIESTWISAFWPAAWRRASVDYFAFQAAVNDLQAVAAHGVGLKMINEILKVPGLETPILWLLGTQQREVRIARAAAAQGFRENRAQINYVLGAAALSQGDAGAASRLFAEALEGGDKRALAPFLFSACRSGQPELARKMAERHASGPIRNSLARCW